MGFFDFLFGSDDEEQTRQTQETVNKPTEFVKAPEYSESEGARGLLWTNLQKWGNAPGFGAISPDWEDIWSKAKSKVNRYYWGGPSEGGGLAGKVRASAARRNVSDSPALESELTNLGMQEGIQLGDIATQQATQQAQFGETGRQNWITSLMNLMGLKPQVSAYSPGSTVTGTTYSPSQDTGIFGAIAPLIGQIIGQNSQQNWLSGLIKGQQNNNTGMPSTTGGDNAIGEGEGAWGVEETLRTGAQVLPYALAAFSSRKLKKNIKQIEGSLGKVKKLKGVKFDWIESGSTSGGVIAEDVEKVMPEAVTMIDGIKAIKPMVIIGHLIEAVKELSERGK